MVLTRQFRATVQARAQRDARFRRALLTEAINELLARDFGAGKALLRDYINATLGFEQLGADIGRPAKSLQRMLGPSGNPTAGNLIGILKALQEHEEVTITVRLSRVRLDSNKRGLSRAVPPNSSSRLSDISRVFYITLWNTKIATSDRGSCSRECFCFASYDYAV